MNGYSATFGRAVESFSTSEDFPTFGNPAIDDGGGQRVELGADLQELRDLGELDEVRVDLAHEAGDPAVESPDERAERLHAGRPPERALLLRVQSLRIRSIARCSLRR